MRPTLPHHHPLNHRTAVITGFPGAPVHSMPILKAALAPLAIHVI